MIKTNLNIYLDKFMDRLKNVTVIEQIMSTDLLVDGTQSKLQKT